VIGYLQDFLFTPDRARTPVKVLSGGERNRLFLARLFTKPSNFLVMDEPTNDLDIETQELLEELLMEYSGTVILVSHDRAFLNNVVTSTIVVDGQGGVDEYAGGYDDWLAQYKPKPKPLSENPKLVKVEKNVPEVPAAEEIENVVRRPLSTKEEAELKRLPELIGKLEAEYAKLSELLADINFYKDRKEAAKTQSKADELGDDLLRAYKRWEYLESLKSES